MNGDDDLGGLDRIHARFDGMADLDAADMQEIGDELIRIMIEDNRKGVLEGKDRYDQDAPPLGYRSGSGSPTKARGGRSKAFGTVRGRLKGVSDFTFSGKLRRNVLHEKRRRGRWMNVEILPNNNLSTRTYQQLTGPRLAPRGDASRTITNYRGLEVQPRPDGLTVVCGWFDVISAKGIPFLHFHFDGSGRNARYDLRGVRAWGMGQARETVRKWIHWFVGAR